MINDSAPKMTLCPHCNQYHPVEGKFCPVTGMVLTPAVSTCPNCGKERKPEWARCPYCAYPLQDQPSEPLQTRRKWPLMAFVLAPLVVLALAGLIWVTVLQPRDLAGLVPENTTPISVGAFLNGEDAPSHLEGAHPSPTSLLSPTGSHTPTSSVTITASPTPTQRDTPTPTLLSTATPTQTASLTPIILPTLGPWEACQGSYLTRLYVGDHAYVSYDPPLSNRVRSAPGLSGRILGRIQPGEEVEILDGPACENNWVWWRIRSQKTSLTGWTAEGDSEDYWLVPLPRLSEITPSIDDETVQIGFFDSIYLRFDPDEWEAINEFGEQIEFNNNNEAIYALQNMKIAGCLMRGNLGFGPSSAWERQDSNLMIGNLEYRVETWIEVATQKPILVVYQYPAGRSGFGTRIELKIEREAEECMREATKVLGLSEDLILENAP
jgi:hypothetical protein